MPDLRAGSTVLAADTPPTVANTQDGSFTFDSTVFGVDADSGTYVQCAVVFVAATTGRALVRYAADLDGNGVVGTHCGPHVRTGGTIGSGSDVLPASQANSVRNVGTDNRRYGATVLLESLTPGASYNVRLEHRVSGGTGTIQFRHLSVSPAS
jgi:hypothetical protein